MVNVCNGGDKVF